MKIAERLQIETLTLHALRVWSRPEQTPALFDRLSVFRYQDRHNYGYLENRSHSYSRLEGYIKQLGDADHKPGGLLLLRFRDDLTARQIARKWNLSQDHINRMQRDAIQQLATLIEMEEREHRKNRAGKQLAKLVRISSDELIGRDTELRELLELLHLDANVWMVAITGLGGIGKTALAHEALRRIILTDAYHSVLWIDAKYGGSDWIIEELAISLGIQNLPAGQKEQEVYLHLRRPHLIVVDGLDTSNLDEGFSKSIAWLASPSKFLLTSRKLPDLIAGVYALKLNELNGAYSRKLLITRARLLGLQGVTNELKEKSDEVLELTGGNPLALKLITGLLHVFSISKAISAIRANAAPAGGPLFNQIFLAAFAALPKSTQLMLLGFLVSGNDGATIRQIQSTCSLPETDVIRSLERAASQCLVEVRSNAQGVRYVVHNLTRTFLEWQRQTETSTQGAFRSCVRENLAYWTGQTVSAERAQLIRNEGANLLAAARYGLEHTDLLKHVVELVLALENNLSSSYFKAPWIEVIRNLIADGASLFTGQDLARLSFCMATLEWQTGETLDAHHHFLSAKRFVDEKKATAFSIAIEVGIALTDAETGRHKKAKKDLRDRFDALKGSLPLQEQGKMLTGLGLVYFICGNYSSAETYFCRAYGKLEGKSKLVIAQLWASRGLCHLNLSHPTVALKHFRLALEAIEGETELRSEQAQIELLRSAAFFQLGDMENAETALRRCRDLSHFGHNQESRAFLESSLGRIFLETGKTKAAKAVLKKASRLWKQAGKPLFALDAKSLFARIALAKVTD